MFLLHWKSNTTFSCFKNRSKRAFSPIECKSRGKGYDCYIQFSPISHSTQSMLSITHPFRCIIFPLFFTAFHSSVAVTIVHCSAGCDRFRKNRIGTSMGRVGLSASIVGPWPVNGHLMTHRMTVRLVTVDLTHMCVISMRQISTLWRSDASRWHTDTSILQICITYRNHNAFDLQGNLDLLRVNKI